MKPSFPSLRGQGAIALDCETYDPDLLTLGPGYLRDGYIAGISIATEKGFKEYYPIAHEGGDNLPKEKVLGWLREQLKLPVPKIGAHLLYDLGYLAEAGVTVTGPFYDIQNAEPLLDESSFSYSLENIAQKHLGESKVEDELMTYLKTHFGKKHPKANIWRAPGNVVRNYAIGDVDLPLRIFAKQKAELEKQNLWELFQLESRLVPMLLAMKRRGVRVDIPYTEKLYQDFTKRMQKLLKEIKRQSGRDISVWNANDIAGVFKSLGLTYPRTPKTDAPSFRAEFLEAHPHPVAGMIREARKMDKLKETMLKGCILEQHIKGRVHCQFNQLRSDDGGTVSGRFSSSNPNLQFIPTRTDDGKALRAAFIADSKDHHFFSADYSQIEFKIFVHDAVNLQLAGALKLAEQYKANPDTDFHNVVAEITGLRRDYAKTVTFGLAYGEGVDKLCRGLQLSREDGEKIISRYHARAPFLKQLSQHCMGQAARTGEIKTLFGRKRRFNRWEIKRNGQTQFLPHRITGSKRAFTYRALNARTQGSAADILKNAMVNVWESGVCDVLGVPSLTVHDELSSSAPKSKAGQEALREMKHIMESAAELNVALRVDIGTGNNWKEAKA